MRIYTYLLMSYIHWPPRKKVLIKALDKIFKQFPGKNLRIVDIGSGPGLLASAIRGEKINYLGIDSDPGIIRYCNKLFRDIPELVFSDINIADSAFQFDKNDIILLIGAVHHFHDTVFSELLKKATKGTALIISDHARETLIGKNQLLPSILQRLDRGKFIRPYKYFETIEGYTLDHSEKFSIKIAGITFWTYFCNVYRP